jgi:soluble lytic murein transglycosylase-like protein
MQRWLSVAANYPLTLYGMLARDRLNLDADFDFQAPKLDPSSMAELLVRPAGMRALALLQSGEPARAEREILRLGDWKQVELNRAVMRFAAHAELPSLSLMLARRVLSDDRTPGMEKRLVGALYPIPPWRPEEGFLIDRALIYAVMHQESSFDPLAKSPDGARGLMQLMPRTAAALDPQRRFRGALKKLLYDPSFNIGLGQRYLKKLLGSQRVRKNLLRLAVAYNAGPGNLAIWDRRMDYDDDPLLFLETLPARETRLFVERVLTNLWVYRQRLGQATPSLRALASGAWPEYRTIDEIRTRVMLQEAFYHRRDPGQARAVQSD